jgi:hypothetical protein
MNTGGLRCANPPYGINVIASEAKQSISQLAEACIASSLSLLAMTGECAGFNYQTAGGYASAFSRHGVPELCVDCPPSKEERGRRESRMRAAPAVSCATFTKKHAHEHTGPAEAIRLSLRSGFKAYNVLSSVYRAC